RRAPRRSRAFSFLTRLFSVWAAVPPPGLLSARNDAGPKPLHVGADLAGTREPDAIAVARHVLQRAAQLRQAIRSAHDERMQRDRAHERLALGLPQHLVELIDDHV